MFGLFSGMSAHEIAFASLYRGEDSVPSLEYSKSDPREGLEEEEERSSSDSKMPTPTSSPDKFRSQASGSQPGTERARALRKSKPASRTSSKKTPASSSSEKSLAGQGCLSTAQLSGPALTEAALRESVVRLMTDLDPEDKLFRADPAAEEREVLIEKMVARVMERVVDDVGDIVESRVRRLLEREGALEWVCVSAAGRERAGGQAGKGGNGKRRLSEDWEMV